MRENSFTIDLMTSYDWRQYYLITQGGARNHLNGDKLPNKRAKSYKYTVLVVVTPESMVIN